MQPKPVASLARMLAATAVLAIAGCSTQPTPVASLEPSVTIECGPIVDRGLCLNAAAVAATAKINAPPIVRVSVRRPAVGDACLTGMHPCGAGDVIVSIQSGDTIQDVALVRSTDGWIRYDQIR